MPTDLADSTSGGTLIFPGDAVGIEFKLRETAVYDAEEVRAELGNEETPQFGLWLPVETPGDGEGWLNSPGELREELIDAEAAPGETYRVTRMEKNGTEETSAYEVNLEKVTAGDQSRLG